MLDEVLPWDSRPRATIADLSCGSGAFLSEAFRRLVFQQGKAAGGALNYEQLKALLTQCIFGVDVSIAAARIAAFGLYLALLDELDPPTVWAEAVLPALLGKNLVVADAFSGHPLADRTFDAVVGNPPWASRLTAAAGKWLQAKQRYVADKQIAEAFVWLAESQLSEGGKLALVLPSKAVLHNRSRQAVRFRRSMFAALEVETVLDLSALRKSLFTQAVAPAAVIVARKRRLDKAATSASVLHVAPHPRTHGRSVDALVVVPEEVRVLPRAMVERRPDLWKVLLWGGQRDLDLIDHLRLLAPTLGEVADQRGWVTGQGFQVAGGDANDATAMQGLPMLSVASLGTLEAAQPAGVLFEYESVHRTRAIGLYRAPVVVIGRTFKNGRITAALLTADTAFNNAMIGVAAPASDKALLYALVATVTSSLGHYWHFLTSSSWGVERDFVELNEHLGLPLAAPTGEQSQRLQEVIALGREGVSSGELDEVVFDLYGLSPLDRQRVRATTSDTMRRFQLGASAPRVSSDVQEGYLSTLQGALSESLPSLHVTAEARQEGSYMAVTVRLSLAQASRLQERGPVDVGSIVESLAQKSPHTSGIVAQPGGIFLDDDRLFIVKTHEADRWTFDAALSDAEDVLTVLTQDK